MYVQCTCILHLHVCTCMYKVHVVLTCTCTVCTYVQCTCVYVHVHIYMYVHVWYIYVHVCIYMYIVLKIHSMYYTCITTFMNVYTCVQCTVHVQSEDSVLTVNACCDVHCFDMYCSVYKKLDLQ